MSKKQAASRFKRFHGREPCDKREIASVKMRGAVNVLKVGQLAGLIYDSEGDGQTYIHRIKKSSRPALYVSADGSQVFILGGRMKFTERGFVDRKPPKRR